MTGSSVSFLGWGILLGAFTGMLAAHVLLGHHESCSVAPSLTRAAVTLGSALMGGLCWGRISWGDPATLRTAQSLAALDTTLPHATAVLLEHIGWVILAAFGLALTLSDLLTRQLPDRLMAVGTLTALLVWTLAAWLSGDGWPITRALLGGLLGAAVFLGAALWEPGSLGGGDVKLGGILSAQLFFLDAQLVPLAALGALSCVLLQLGWVRSRGSGGQDRGGTRATRGRRGTGGTGETRDSRDSPYPAGSSHVCGELVGCARVSCWSSGSRRTVSGAQESPQSSGRAPPSPTGETGVATSESEFFSCASGSTVSVRCANWFRLGS